MPIQKQKGQCKHTNSPKKFKKKRQIAERVIETHLLRTKRDLQGKWFGEWWSSGSNSGGSVSRKTVREQALYSMKGAKWRWNETQMQMNFPLGQAVSGAFGLGLNLSRWRRERIKYARLLWKMSEKKSGLLLETKQRTEKHFRDFFFSSCGNRISTLIWNPPKFTAVHSLWCAFGMVYSVFCHVTTGGYDGLMDPTNADQFLKVLLCPIRSTSSINWSTNDSMLVWNYSKQKWN